MRDALVFNGASCLDLHDVRANVIRIPEVVSRIRETQAIWDAVASEPLDLANFIAGEDEVFLRNIKLKSFATALVQVGLLDRYLRQHELPEFVIGAINGDSPLKVALKKNTFFDMVTESPATGSVPEPQLRAVRSDDLPVLSGVQIVEYAVFQRGSNGDYERLVTSSRDVQQMLMELFEHCEVSKLTVIGPGTSVLGNRTADWTARDVQVLESIDLDPMLSWFWTRMRENRLAIAN